MIDPALTTIRLALYADLSLLLGIPLFLHCIAAPGFAMPRRTLAALTVAGIILSVSWLQASASVMADAPLLQSNMAVIAILLSETQLGAVLAVRITALLLLLAGLAGNGPGLILIMLAAVAGATCAWTGHAGATDGAAAMFHRLADIIHLWAAAGWIGALAILSVRLWQRDDLAETARMLRDFAPWGTSFVIALAITGLINGGAIAGWPGILAMPANLYAMLLACKLCLFAAMLLLAAVNRWCLTPRLQAGGGAAVTSLRLTLTLESGVALLILLVVAIIGTLDPLPG